MMQEGPNQTNKPRTTSPDQPITPPAPQKDPPDNGPSLPKPETVMLYHTTTVESFTSILKHGLFLRTDTWTVSPVAFGDEYPSMATVAFRLPSEQLTGTRRLLPDKTPAHLPDEVRAKLERLDRFYLPQDEFYTTSMKPHFVRSVITCAHNLLTADKNGTLRRIDPSSLDIAEILRINEWRRSFQAIRAVIDEFLNSKERKSATTSHRTSLTEHGIDLLGKLYQRIPKWEARSQKYYK